MQFIIIIIIIITFFESTYTDDVIYSGQQKYRIHKIHQY